MIGIAAAASCDQAMLENSGQGAEDLSEDAEGAGAGTSVAAALACLDCLPHADPWKEADLAEQVCIPHTTHLSLSALEFWVNHV